MFVRIRHNLQQGRSISLILTGLLPILLAHLTTPSTPTFDAFVAQDTPPSTNGPRVAAIVYRGLHPERVSPQCTLDDTCAIEVLIRRAQDQGAKLVVAPEYGLDQLEPEPNTAIGSIPQQISPSAKLTQRFAYLADELDIYLVINLETRSGDNDFNTQLAFDPKGKLVAKHHKFELYAGERETMTAGNSVSTFDTPFGRVGLLICADLYGDPGKHRQLTHERGAQIIAFSAQWTVEGAPRWQAAFAHDWGVYFVGSNGASGLGQGGGIFDPKGRPLAEKVSGEANILMATLPLLTDNQ